jgi:hypothetical protein
MLFKNSVRTWNRTPNFTITPFNFLTLFKEIIADYSEKLWKTPKNTKCSITDCQSRWFLYLPIGLKGLRSKSSPVINIVGICVPAEPIWSLCTRWTNLFFLYPLKQFGLCVPAETIYGIHNFYVNNDLRSNPSGRLSNAASINLSVTILHLYTYTMLLNDIF